MTSPLAHLRRTPLRRMLEARGATWRMIGDAAVADTVDADQCAHRLAVADLSPLPRLGFKGPGTIDAMKRRAILLDATANRASRQPDGSICLVLDAEEVVLLSNLEGHGVKLRNLETSWRIEDEERTYIVPRRDSDVWLAVCGSEAPAMFAKVCAVDMRLDRFPDLAIAQTLVARIPSIIIRADSRGVPLFHVLADSVTVQYLWSCLTDAASEFGGEVVGTRAIRELASP